MQKSLTKRLLNLPVKPEKLHKWILVGKITLAARIKAIKAIEQLEEGVAARAAALSDTQDLAEELLYAEARLGDILEKTPKQGKKRYGSLGGTIPTLPKGITKKQSHQAQKLYHNEDAISQIVSQAREKGAVPLRSQVLHEIDKKKAHVSYNTGQSDWFTPPKYIEAARKVMGSIDCDPASTEKANKVIKAKTFYTVNENGLRQKWYGNIWLNPPYKQPVITEFIEKLIWEKFTNSSVDQACVLVNNATDTKFGQLLMRNSSAVCFPTGRIKFNSPDDIAGAPLQGQMILYLGENFLDFMKEFEKFGVCWKK